MSPVRQAALDALLAVDDARLTLPAAVERERTSLTDARDVGLLLQLVAGTLRWRNAIDAVIAARSRRAVADLDRVVRASLRLSIYQLRYLDRVPAHAVVNDAVDLVKANGQARAAGFVNAVLRASQRTKTSLPARPGPTAARAARLRYLSITLSHPEWLVSRWLDRYGFDATEAWCRHNNQTPALVARLPAGEARQIAGGRLRQSDVLDDAVLVSDGPDSLPYGTMFQDEGSQLVAHATPLPAVGRVLDLCASPGNKTRILAERGGGTVQVVAADYRPARVERLKATLSVRHSVPVVRLDARRPLPFGPAFDTVLLDAPCSGLGTLSREPDLKWSRRESELPALADAQAAMLASAAAVVRPGGRLVYATCSSEPDENEDVVQRFLALSPDFALVPVQLGAPVREPARFVDPAGYLRTRPDRDGLDAFFAAVLVRRGAA